MEGALVRVAFPSIDIFNILEPMSNSTETNEGTAKMPHSTSPESTAADESSRTTPDVIKPEPETQDIAMDDAPSPAAEAKPKVNLEELFDDEDSDEEFPSSAPVLKSEEELSQPAPLYIRPRKPNASLELTT
jgi:DNA primase small subunit